MPNRREEVYNVKLAELLELRGAAKAEAEQRYGSDMPDVLFEWFGLSAVLEAKYDEAGASALLGVQVKSRLDAGFATLGLGVLYPQALKTAGGDVANALDPAVLKIQLTAVGRSPGPWHEVAGVEGLVAVLDQARAALIDDDELRASVELLSQSVDALARAFSSQEGHADEIVRLVTATEATSKGPVSAGEHQAAFRVAALAVITATMLQLVLCDRDPEVPSITKSAAAGQRQALLAGWKVVLAHDYRAVFEIAHGILQTLGDSDARLGASLASMLEQAERIVAKGVFGRHDLVGRVYHTLLLQQKFLATYYTSVPAATLLAALATTPAAWPDVDWTAEPGEFSFSFADPACGTGTLLAATLATSRRHYASARRQARKDVDAWALGRRLIEDNVYGFDILAYAVQVCASTLLLSSPGTVVSRSLLYQLPFGGPNGQLGSLDFLFGAAEGSLFGAWGDSISADGVVGQNVLIDLPQVDLVIMNPPFTRTQGGSRLLGSLSPDDWPTARRNLDRLAARPNVEGRVVAGLGALFVPLGDSMVREGGRLAFVLPKTMLTGTQWDRTRTLLSAKYHIETIICSHEPGHWNFSDSTDLAEILVLARKLRAGEDRAGQQTTWIQLTKNPGNAIDALGVAAGITRMGPPGPNGQTVSLGSGMFSSFGEAFSRPTPTDSRPWRHAMFTSAELDSAATAMLEGAAVPLPRSSSPWRLPLKPLHELAEVGPDRARLHDGFVRTASTTGYPCLWGHDSQLARTMTGTPNIWIAPSSKREGDHARRYASQLWEGAGPLMIAERMWLTTYRASAILLNEKALANVMWPVRLRSEDPDGYKLLVLWLNSTLGLTCWIGIAEETRGPWLGVKKNKIVELPVLDVGALSAAARSRLLKCWDLVSSAELQPIAKAAHDPVRQMIDQAMADALELPSDSVEVLRTIFSAESRLQPAERRLAVTASPKPDVEELSLFG